MIIILSIIHIDLLHLTRKTGVRTFRFGKTHHNVIMLLQYVHVIISNRIRMCYKHNYQDVYLFDVKKKRKPQHDM